MANSPDKRMDLHVHTVSSIDFELDEDLPDIDITDRSVATESKEKLEWRKRQLKSLCDANPHLLQEWRAQVLEVLTVHHNVFSLEDGEQGETSLPSILETHPQRGKQHERYPMEPGRSLLIN